MNVITIEEPAFDKIMSKIDSLEKNFAEIVNKAKNPLKDKWLDNQEVLALLKISIRQLQIYRTKRQIPYSLIGQKLYYKASDIDKFLESRYYKAKGF